MEACIDNIRSMVSSNDYMISLTVDKDDKETMKSRSVAINFADIILNVGYSRNKVHAINRGVPKWAKWDILVNMSDDMVFTQKGFDDVIRKSFDNLDQFLHFPDGYVNDKLATMSIMGREHFDRFGYVYHPSYTSLWCDNEAQEVAQILSCYKYCDNHIFEHRHPLWTGEHQDKLLKHTQSFYHADKKVYDKRKATNFGL